MIVVRSVTSAVSCASRFSMSFPVLSKRFSVQRKDGKNIGFQGKTKYVDRLYFVRLMEPEEVAETFDALNLAELSQ